MAEATVTTHSNGLQVSKFVKWAYIVCKENF